MHAAGDDVTSEIVAAELRERADLMRTWPCRLRHR